MLTLMLCVNHHRNGAFTGRCRDISLGDALTLDSPYIDASLKCEIETARFRLGKVRWWPHAREIPWLGNWCWQGLRVTAATAADVLNFALAKGYTPTVGWCTLWEKIDAGQAIGSLDLFELEREWRTI